MLLKNKTAVITGCNRGIGKAVLTKFAENGANIFAVIRTENEDFKEYCKGLEKSYGITIDFFYADFTKEDSVKLVAKEILKKKCPIDILVNNIGMSYSASILAMTKMESIREVFEVNFFSHIILTQSIEKNMMRNKCGSIVFVSSTAVYDAWSNLEYVASKSAMNGAMKRLSLELGMSGIRVNSVAPGLLDTDMAEAMSENDEKAILARNVMHRKGKVEEVADAIVFLASDMSTFVTGQVLRVDGGLL